MGDSANWPSGRGAGGITVMPDDHSEVVPLLPIPNRTVKRLCADDSASTRVKVGHRQASYYANPRPDYWSGVFAFALCIRMVSASLPRGGSF